MIKMQRMEQDHGEARVKDEAQRLGIIHTSY